MGYPILSAHTWTQSTAAETVVSQPFRHSPDLRISVLGNQRQSDDVAGIYMFDLRGVCAREAVWDAR